MLALEVIAERRIEEAIAQGLFDTLPGAGRPLDLDDDPLVPAEARMARRILRNAGIDACDLAQELRERFSARERFRYVRRAAATAEVNPKRVFHPEQILADARAGRSSRAALRSRNDLALEQRVQILPPVPALDKHHRFRRALTQAERVDAAVETGRVRPGMADERGEATRGPVHIVAVESHPVRQPSS